MKKMIDPIPQTVEDIKSIKIQGATNVALAALKSLKQKIQLFPETSPAELKKDMGELKQSRKTEPMMFNVISFVSEAVETKEILKKIDLILSKIEDINREIVENAAPLIKNNSVILTHCHSSLVEKAISEVVKKGKKITVFVTETRPLNQGKITAENLTKAGANVIMITDSLAPNILSNGYAEGKKNLKVDFVFVGADSIEKNGKSFFNKTGTFSVSKASSSVKIPVYVLSSLLKVSEKKTEIEVRKDEEIFKINKKNFDSYNPAFDEVSTKYITGFLTEFGLIPPKKVKYYVEKYYPFILKKRTRNLSVGTSRDLSLQLKNKIISPADKINPYSSYLHLHEKLNLQDLLVATYKLQVEENGDFLRTSGGVAAESSVGTWTKVQTQFKPVWDKLHAKVFEADEKSGIIKIAYPLELFEKGNIAQLLSSVAGNIFGLKEISALRLLDLDMPESYVKSFDGPAIGLEGVLKIAGLKEGPLIGSIIKPKLGLSYVEHAKVAMEVFRGGGNLVKDDENLTSQIFNPFYERVKLLTSEMKKFAFLQNSSGEKIYAFNVTAEAEEMKERASFVKMSGGNCAMIDILTSGFSSVQFLRKQNLGLILHGHRAMHAAFTRNVKEGVTMLVLAKLARLSGIDELHTGTVVGKMEGGEQEVITINNFLTSEWFGLKKVMPVASGGLHPGMIPRLFKYLGKNVIYNFGGGIHGHPKGTFHGARAAREGFEAVTTGQNWEEYVAQHEDLKEAVEQWSK